MPNSAAGMMRYTNIQAEVEQNGYAVAAAIFSPQEVERLCSIINGATTTGAAFRKSAGLFAIRRVLQEIPDLQLLVFSSALQKLITGVFGPDFFIVKSLYFDKPPLSNWFVASHQDLTIAVNQRADLPGFCNWTVKPGQFAVQPPVAILQNNFTLRIHLDDTDEKNGALLVVPGSHRYGIDRLEKMPVGHIAPVHCPMKKGGVLLMKPLLFHASGRTTNAERRRVLHIEFSKSVLPSPLHWAEYSVMPAL